MLRTLFDEFGALTRKGEEKMFQEEGFPSPLSLLHSVVLGEAQG
jgi:hypothetical protein